MKIEQIALIHPDVYDAGKRQYYFSLALPLVFGLLMASIPFVGTSLGMAMMGVSGCLFVVASLYLGFYAWVVWWRLYIKRSKIYNDEPAIKQGYSMCNPLFSIGFAVVMLLCGVDKHVINGIWGLWMISFNIRGAVAFAKYRKLKKWAK